MDITVDRDNLATTLKDVQGAVSSKGSMPILSSVKLDASGDELKVYATNLDISIGSQCIASVEEPGSIAVNAKRLIDVVKTLSGDVRLRLTSDKLKITCDKSKFTVPTDDVESFPSIPESGDAPSLEIKASEIEALIGSVIYCVSKDETRMTLNGAYLDSIDGKMVAVATDGHRLSLCHSLIEWTAKGVIIPRAALAEIMKMATISIGSAEMSILDNHAIFKFPVSTIAVRLIEGAFPSYGAIIPKESTSRVKANKSDTVAALKRVTTMADTESNMVTVAISNGIMALSSKSTAGESNDEVVIDYVGDDITLGISGVYLIEAFLQVDSDTVCIDINDALSPVVIKSPDNDDINIVMPMRL